MLKVIYGTWASHVFCYLPADTNDEWFSKNQDWHLCEKRCNHWFKELKIAQHLDAINFDIEFDDLHNNDIQNGKLVYIIRLCTFNIWH